jgi:prepilin-type N-terminal cleavage/methylation domain-containing protein
MTDPSNTRAARTRAGFTIIEVIIALIILTVGVLGMAGTTAWVVRSVTMAEATTDRSAALQSVIERLNGMDFDSLGTGADTLGAFIVDWTVAGSSPIKTATIITTGPGMVPVTGTLPTMSNTAVDTFTYMVVHP